MTSWQASLCLSGIGLICLCAAAVGLAKWHHKRFLRIPNDVLNAHRITPRFIVGSDCKDACE